MGNSRRNLTAIAIIALAGCLGTKATAPAVDTKPTVIAHRGSSYAAPEHTFAAYDRALSEGADYIEQDVHRTRDGVLVVIHDATLDRTARGDPAACAGLVADRTLAEIRTCDAGSWFNAQYPGRARPEYIGLGIPTLAEVFERFGSRTRYYIEIKDPEKYPGIEAGLIELLNASGLRVVSALPQRVLVQSFSAVSLKRVHQLDPTIPLVQLTGNAGSAALVSVLSEVRMYAVGIGPHAGSVDEALIAAAHDQCLLVHPYTVDEQSQMLALLAIGADGLFTNRPDRMQAAVGSRRRAALPAHCTT